MVNKKIKIIDDTEKEIWKDIIGTNGTYKVSNMGKIMNAKTKGLRNSSICGNEVSVTLRIDGKQKTIQWKTVVANHFLDKVDGKPAIINIDGNLLNNKVSNLKWVSLNELLVTKKTLHMHKNTDIIDNTDYTNENWKQIDESDMLEISDFGRLKHNNSGYIYIPSISKNGSMIVEIKHNNNRTLLFIHQLVAKYFIPNIENKPIVIHIDKDKSNNKVSNLKWGYHYEFKSHMDEITNEMKNANDNIVKQNKIDRHKIEKNVSDILIEEWKPINEYPQYLISNFGTVKIKKTDKILKYDICNNYYRVGLSKNGKKKHFLVNILVAKHFIEIPEIYSPEEQLELVADHIDNNPKNNRADNLRWITKSENTYSYNINYKNYDNCKTILQYDKPGNLIKEWSNMIEIIKANPKFRSTVIYANCSGSSRTAYNYIWKYKDARETPVFEKDEIFKNCGIIDDIDLSNYEISNYGKVKSLFRNIILEHDDTKEYSSVKLCDTTGTQQYKYQVHRLVAIIFVYGRTKERNVVNHLDENQYNNYYKNLEWTTPKENTEYSLGRKVVMIDKMNNNIIKTFISMADAAKFLGMKSCNNISACCNGKKETAHGYKWKLLEQLSI